MGLLDALKKASEAKEVKLTAKIVSQALAEAVAEQLEEKHPKVTRPKLVFCSFKRNTEN
jgi:DNA primase